MSAVKDDPTPSGPSSEEVLAAVRATGFLLEQEVAQTLQSLGFHSTVSRAFQDPEENKSREVDVTAYRGTFRDEEIRTSFGVEIIAECKNTSGPFVVVGRSSTAPATQAEARLQPPEATFWAGNRISYPVSGRSDAYYQGSPWRWLGFGELPGSLDQQEFIGSQLLRMNRAHGKWKADNNQIFDSVVLPMAKALQAFQKERRSDPSSVRPFDPKFDWASGVVTFPMLVTTADLFQIDADAESVKAEPVQWVLVERELRTKSFNGKMTIAVVNVDHLSDYVTQQVLAFGHAASAILKLNPKALTARETFELRRP